MLAKRCTEILTYTELDRAYKHPALVLLHHLDDNADVEGGPDDNRGTSFSSFESSLYLNEPDLPSLSDATVSSFSLDSSYLKNPNTI